MKTVSTMAVEETFADLEKMIYHFTYGFVRKYGLDVEEVKSAAFYGFMQAFHSYDPKVGEFSTWVGTKVTNRVLDLLRSSIKNRKRYLTGVDDAVLDRPLEDRPGFDFETWLTTLSKDARKVARLAIREPIDVKLVRKQLGQETSEAYRTALRMVLAECGWTKNRTKRAFQEIKEAL